MTPNQARSQLGYEAADRFDFILAKSMGVYPPELTYAEYQAAVQLPYPIREALAYLPLYRQGISYEDAHNNYPEFFI